MNNAADYQNQIIARQQLAQNARAARDYTRRHPVADASEPTPRTPRLHLRWHHPAPAGMAHG